MTIQKTEVVSSHNSVGVKQNESVSIEPEKRLEHLNAQIDTIKTLLSHYKIDVPFFIAGGSVFSIMNCRSPGYADIDVYFYTKDDFDFVKSKFPQDVRDGVYATKNAWTISALPRNVLKKMDYEQYSKERDTDDLWDISNSSCASGPTSDTKTLQRPIQFIIKRFGTPQEIFESFDFNCSMCAYTSEREVVTSPIFSKYIKHVPENIHGDVFTRYKKYISDKGAIDTDNQTIKHLFDYFIKNYDTKMTSGYNDRECDAIHRLTNYVLYETNDELTNYIHDKIVEILDESQRMEIFGLLMEVFNTLTVPACDEFNAQRIIFNEERAQWKTPAIAKTNRRSPYYESKYFIPMSADDMHRAKVKYAELFI